jgi:hypothetical protein
VIKGWGRNPVHNGYRNTLSLRGRSQMAAPLGDRFRYRQDTPREPQADIAVELLPQAVRFQPNGRTSMPLQISPMVIALGCTLSLRILEEGC